MELLSIDSFEKKLNHKLNALPFAFQPAFMRAHQGVRVLSFKDLFAPVQFNTNKGFKTVRYMFPPLFRNGTLPALQDEKKFIEESLQFIKNKKLAHRIAQPYNFSIFRTVPENTRYCAYGTYRINLKDRTDLDLLQNMQARYRTAINQADRLKPEIKLGVSELDGFYQLHEETMKRTGAHPESYQSIKNDLERSNQNTLLATVYINDELQGGLFLYTSKFGAYYMHGASASTTLAQGAIKWLHYKIMCKLMHEGVAFYDFVGARLSDVSGTKLEGIQNFKKRFGSELIEAYLWKSDIDKKICRAHDTLLKLKCKVRKTEYPYDIIDQETRKIKTNS